MSETLPLAAEDGAILYLPQGAVARAQYIDKLAQTDPTDDAKLTVVVGGVAYNTTWGALKAANLEAVPQLAMEAISGDVQAVETARQQVEGNAGVAASAEEAARLAAGQARDSETAAAEAQRLADLAKATALDAATGASSSALVASEAASSAGVAAAAAAAGSNLFPTVTDGLAATAEGLSFGVQGAGASFADYYRKTAGNAVFIGALPSKDAVTTLQGMVMQIEDDTGMGIAFLDGPDRNIMGYLALDGQSAAFGGITLRRLPDGAVQVEDAFGNPLLTRSAAGNIAVAGLGIGFMESEDAFIQILDGPDGNVLFAVYRDGTMTGAPVSSDTLTDPQQAIVRALADQRIVARVIGPVDARRLGNNGDSLGAHGNDRGATQFGPNQRGFLSHLLFHTERRLISTAADNYAIAGSQSSAILARAAGIAAGGYGYISQLGGSINDVIHDVAAETTFANWAATMDIYLAGGARPICTPILPHSSTGWITDSGASEQSQRDKINWIANKQRLYARQHPGVIWVEAGRDIVDPATGNLYPWAAYDHSSPGGGTHTAPRAAFLVGRRMARAVLPYLPPATYLRPDPTDLRTAANPLGNLLNNPGFLGTGGTVSAPHSGVLPDGWSTGQATIGTITGGTVTWSLEPRADGLPGQRLVLTIVGLTGTNSQTQLFARQVIPLSSLRYAAGDILEAVSGIEVAAGSVGITEAAMRLIETDGTTALIFGSLSAYGANPITDQAFSGPLLAQPAAVRPASGAGTPSLEFRLGVFADATVFGGASLVAKWDLPSLNKVA